MNRESRTTAVCQWSSAPKPGDCPVYAVYLSSCELTRGNWIAQAVESDNGELMLGTQKWAEADQIAKQLSENQQ
jgi:hypothetical protein